MGFETLNQGEFEKLKEESQPEVPEELLELQKQAWKGGKGELNEKKKEKDNRKMIKDTKEEYKEMSYEELTETLKIIVKEANDSDEVLEVRSKVVRENLKKKGLHLDTLLDILKKKEEER